MILLPVPPKCITVPDHILTDFKITGIIGLFAVMKSCHHQELHSAIIQPFNICGGKIWSLSSGTISILKGENIDENGHSSHIAPGRQKWQIVMVPPVYNPST